MRICVSLAVHPRRRKAIGQTASQPFQHLWIYCCHLGLDEDVGHLSLNEGIPDIILGEVEIAGCFWGSLSAPLSVSMFDPCPFRGGIMLLGCSSASTCIGTYASIIFKMSNARGSFSLLQKYVFSLCGSPAGSWCLAATHVANPCCRAAVLPCVSMVARSANAWASGRNNAGLLKPALKGSQDHHHHHHHHHILMGCIHMFLMWSSRSSRQASPASSCGRRFRNASSLAGARHGICATFMQLVPPIDGNILMGKWWETQGVVEYTVYPRYFQTISTEFLWGFVRILKGESFNDGGLRTVEVGRSLLPPDFAIFE